MSELVSRGGDGGGADMALMEQLTTAEKERGVALREAQELKAAAQATQAVSPTWHAFLHPPFSASRLPPSPLMTVPPCFTWAPACCLGMVSRLCVICGVAAHCGFGERSCSGDRGGTAHGVRVGQLQGPGCQLRVPKIGPVGECAGSIRHVHACPVLLLMDVSLPLRSVWRVFSECL